VAGFPLLSGIVVGPIVTPGTGPKTVAVAYGPIKKMAFIQSGEKRFDIRSAVMGRLAGLPRPHSAISLSRHTADISY
jgi:hypothetical protein